MPEQIELTDEMRAAIGRPQKWTYEVTTTGVRGFARGVGYQDRVYFDQASAAEAGYSSLPAPPCYLGTPVYIPGEVDETFSVPAIVSPSAAMFGLQNVLDGGTETTYVRPVVAGDVLTATHQISDLTPKQSKALGGGILIVSTTSELHDETGELVATQRSQVIFY
ncbi:MaoC family dehydratase N-terminal domain-containing protein [Blastococcus sp. Marseille-P5729]|uniref:FAS1-like dehydratase domain-containing protein n=1 Tax=Blastococcus sp. Marseille-P5729 TaxID=2086582 RepID=UPI000D0F2C84|nr:MaoC family dehydratase N-terminal domain-containing protein [Blastococcus sp. Marseille-P5729]